MNPICVKGEPCTKKKKASSRKPNTVTNLENGTRSCCVCGIEKPMDEFSRNIRLSGGRRYACKPCESSRSKRYGHKGKHLKNRYGISQKDYDDLFDRQGRVCAVCGEPPKKPQLDHCHTTGRIRGILCQPCNIGMIGIDRGCDWVKKATDYKCRT